MADTTTPVTPPTQDLQINLEDAPKAEVKTSENTSAELDLSLDLNLPEVLKTDDRLKAEDQQNKEIEQPIEVEQKLEEIPVAEKAPVIENLFAEMPAAPVETKVDETPIDEVSPTAEIVKEEVKEETPVVPETPKIEEVPTQETAPSTSIEEILPTPETKIQEPIIEPTTLKEDMKIIDELEGHASAGGLSPEATVIPQAAPVETPKTFDLDAMLGPTQTEDLSVRRGNEGEVVAEAPVTTQPVEQKAEIPGMPPMPTTSATPMQAPVFTIPTTQQTPVQAMPQVTIPAYKKTSGVKTLLFVVLFAALGFTTYFIIQTMYPVEMGNMFGGGDTTQMHASEEVSGDIATLTGETQEITGEIETIETTGTIEETNDFGELNDLGTPTETTTEETDLSRLADYVNKGNDLRDQGKTFNNNTVIKYGLYISKKATDLLEKIAKGEEITNLSGYFAQFDQYITQLEALIGSAETTAEPSSPELPTNETTTAESETTTPAPTTNPFAAE